MIARYLAPLADGVSGAFGLRDDTACLYPKPGHAQAVTCDTLVAGVHFPLDDLPYNAAFKALSVNVSDLAAKGARAEHYLLSLALPKAPDAAWFDDAQRGFCSGLAAAQALYGCRLLGGDTVHSPHAPLTLTITALGTVCAGGFVRRGGARAGDVLFVSGEIGQAALGYELWQAGAGRDGTAAAESVSLQRFLRPQARAALAPVLAAHASAAIDISDGLAGDFAKLCAASRLGGVIDVRRVPCPPAPAEKLETLLGWGDDYEILCAVPPARVAAFQTAAGEAGVPVTRIGEMHDSFTDARLLGPDGQVMRFQRPSFEHFARG